MRSREHEEGQWEEPAPKRRMLSSVVATNGDAHQPHARGDGRWQREVTLRHDFYLTHQQLSSNAADPAAC